MPPAIRKAAPRGGPSAEHQRPVAAASRRPYRAGTSTTGILVTAAIDRGSRLDTGSPPFRCCTDSGSVGKGGGPDKPRRPGAAPAERKKAALSRKGVTMRRSEERILTTHTGSLPRPPELTRLHVRRLRGESVDPQEFDRLGRAAVRRIIEQQREGFFLHIRHRLSGFGGQWRRRPRADVERYPLFRQIMERELAHKEAVSNMMPPKAIAAVRSLGTAAIAAECADFASALAESGVRFVEPFLTAPSPGIIASAMKNEYYDSEESYLAALGEALKPEYETIVNAGFVLQLDCPDLALERHL